MGNIAVPVVIGRDLPRHAGPVLGAYTAALNVGSMLTLALTVPLAGVAGLAGRRWRSWGGLVVAAAAPSGSTPPRGADRGTPGAAAEPEPRTTAQDDRTWWRRPVVWGLTIAFSGQAFAYYGVTAWLPLLLRDELGMARRRRGHSASIFQVAALIGAFGVPVLLRVLPGPRAVVLIVVAGLVHPAARPAVRPRRCGPCGAASAAPRRAAGSW